ncbi:MAG: HRDC domain-containing protein [Spirochaetes bacterium]|nr:HRDC domain-containing protein [Spirochaetota bacterium]
MSIQYAVFKIPGLPDSDEAAVFNKFLRSHSPVRVTQEFVSTGDGSHWAYSVEYLVNGKTEADKGRQGRTDYREILSETDFRLFVKLRALRKEMAEAQGVPVYAVFTNDQLAEIATARPAA